MDDKITGEESDSKQPAAMLAGKSVMTAIFEDFKLLNKGTRDCFSLFVQGCLLTEESQIELAI